MGPQKMNNLDMDQVFTKEAAGFIDLLEQDLVLWRFPLLLLTVGHEKEGLCVLIPAQT